MAIRTRSFRKCDAEILKVLFQIRVRDKHSGRGQELAVRGLYVLCLAVLELVHMTF